jgi:hypothetical protein
MKTITIPIEQYECLRGHLEKANEIFNSLGRIGSGNAPKAAPKLTRQQKVDNYVNRIGSGVRVKKPDCLKKKPKK